MGECIVNLAKVKEAVIQLVDHPGDARALEQAKPQLRGIVAGLLMLNKTNLRVLQCAFGNVMDNWLDKIVVVFSAMVDFRGKMTPALRVKIPPPKDNYRAPPQKPTPKPSVDEEPDGFDDPESLDDDISDVR